MQEFGELPAWVTSIGAPTWVVGADRQIRYVNSQAEELLGRTSTECVGQPCAEIVSAFREAGEPFCNAECSLFRLLRESAPISPLHLKIRNGSSRWITIIPIRIQLENAEAALVECALDETSLRRPLEHFQHMTRNRSTVGDLDRLTPRERNVLHQVSLNSDLRSVSDDLGISYVTVRNHVQHILAKLDVHSIQEAIALYILGLVN